METRAKTMHRKFDETQGLPKRIVGTAVANGVVGVVVSVGLALWMAVQVNNLAADNARNLFETALAAELSSIALTTTDYAHWDLAFELVSNRDDDGLYDNFGSGASDSETFDFIYVIDVDGTPIYGYVTDEEGSDIALVDRDLVAQVRPQLLAQPLEPYPLVSEFAVVYGQLAAVATGYIRPDDLGDMTAQDLPIMVAGKWLSEDRLADIGGQILLQNVELHTDGETHAHEMNLSLLDLMGQTIGHVRWDAPRPGSALLSAILPIVLVLSLLTLAATCHVGRIAAKQTAAFLRERHRARTDKLTGLLNRAGMDELVSGKPMMDALEKGHAAIIYLDLNGFKQLNDRLGHDAGDLALQILAERITGATRETDHSVRLGGDEFLCVLIDPAPCQAASFMAKRIVKATQPAVRIGDDAHIVRPSIGVAVAKPGITWNQLLKNADRAMYRAKVQRTLEPVFYADGIIQSDKVHVA